MEVKGKPGALKELEAICDFKKFSIEEFENIGLLGQYAFDEVKIKHAYGKLTSKCSKCKILIIKGHISSILPYIRNILNTYNSVKENPLFCEVLGFFINKKISKKLEFGLVTLGYEKHIETFRCSRDANPQNISVFISEIFKGINFLHSKGFFYGHLNPDNIKVTINHKPIIELHYFIKQIDQFNLQVYHNELKALKNCQMRYLAPEVIFAFKNKGYSFNAVDPTAIDFFTAGCISFNLIGYKLKPLIFECSSFCNQGLAINQNKECLYNFIKSPYERESVLEKISDFESNIKKMMRKIKNPLIVKFLELSTNVYISKRSVKKFLLEIDRKNNTYQIESVTSLADFTEIIFKFYEIISIIRSIQFTRQTVIKNTKYKPEDSSQGKFCAKKIGFETNELSNPALNSASILSEKEVKQNKNLSSSSLGFYSYIIDGIFEYFFTDYNHNILLDALLKLDGMQNKFTQVFDKAYTSFYSTKCSNRYIKIIDGLMIFLRNSIKFLSGNYSGVIILSQTLKNDELLTKDQFLNFFKQIRNLSGVHQNFIVFSLITMRIERDWHNFFNLIFFSRLSFYKFKDFTMLENEFSSILEKRFVIESLQKFTPSNIDIRFVVNQLLENVYLTRLMSSCGLRTYNHFIFIDCESSDVNSQIINLKDRVIIYIILLHELAYLLRKINCTTFGQAKSTFIQKTLDGDLEKDVEDDFKTEREREEDENKAGFMLEKVLFGKIPKRICVDAADFFLYCDGNMILKDFSRVFRNIQKTGAYQIKIVRSK